MPAFRPGLPVLERAPSQASVQEANDVQEPDPGDTYIDSSALTSADEEEEFQENQHTVAFESVRSKAYQFFQAAGLHPLAVQAIDQQTEAVRSEIQAISQDTSFEPAQAQQMVQASLQKYHRMLSQQLGQQMYLSFIKELGSSKDL